MRDLFPSSGNEGNSSGRKTTAARRAPTRRPEVEPLENRLVPAHIFVYNTADGPVMPIGLSGVAPNLRSAVVNSHSGDEIDLDTKTYFLNGGEGFGELLVQHNLVIKNNAHGVSTIDGQNQTRVFEITSNDGAPDLITMTALKITHGNGNSSGEAGGILVDSGAALTMNSCTVTDNTVTGESARGGGIENFGTVKLNQCIISQNTAQADSESSAFGGGFFQGERTGALTITNTTFLQNRALGGTFEGSATGGGLYVDPSSGPLTVTVSNFVNNTAVGGLDGGSASGGGMYEGTDSPASISTSTFSGNAAEGGMGGGSGQGGGLFFDSELNNLSIVASTFANNRAVGGNTDPEQSGGGDGQGGGLFQSNSGGSVSVSRSTFTANEAVGAFGVSGGGDSDGGGIYQEGGAGNLSVFNSTFGGNSVGLSLVSPGVVGPQVQLTEGPGSGGGLYLAGRGTDLLVNDTIARNKATDFGGGLFVPEEQEGNSPQLWNVLIALNSAPTGPDVFGTIVSLGHNLVGNTSGSNGFSAAKHDLLNVPASKIGLGPLANNGGPTQTMALASISIAINAGDDAVLTNPKTRFTIDQRGQPRKAGSHVDIGAFEFQPPPPPLSTGHSRRNGPPLP